MPRPGPRPPHRHVLLLHQHFVLGDEAGGTRHVELIRHLRRSGLRVTVVSGGVSYLTGERQAAGRVEEGLEVIPARMYAGGSQGFVSRVLSFLSFSASALLSGLGVRGADVVWGTSPPLFQALGALALARLKGVPFVLEVRDLWPDFAVQLGVLRSPVLIRAARWAERLLYHQADAIVVNSPGFTPHLAACGVPEERVALVPNGVEVDDFDPSGRGEAFRRELGVGPGDVLVLYAGAHGVPNDLDTLLDAARQLGDDRRVRVALVGGGRDKARAVERARALGLDNVTFVPAQPKERMPEVLAAADVCVALLKAIPLFDTTYPNKVFDYMAAGRPTVLAIDGVIRRVIEAAEGGIFAPPGDASAMARAVRRYADDPELRRRHGARAREYVASHFRRSDHAETLRRVLEAPGRVWRQTTPGN